MENREREFVESFCAHIKKRDVWLWGDTAKYILANIDYTARALLIENGNEYFVICYLKDGRMVELQKRETGFGCKWESPEEKEKRESQWPDDGLNHFTRANNELDRSEKNMALCKKCGEREQHTFPNGRTVALCSVCGWNALVEFLESPDIGGLTQRALDFCPECDNTGYRRVSPTILAKCSCEHGQSQ